MNSILGMRGLIPVEAQGCTRFAKVFLEIMEVMRTLLVLRMVCGNTQHIEEVLLLYYPSIASERGF